MVSCTIQHSTHSRQPMVLPRVTFRCFGPRMRVMSPTWTGSGRECRALRVRGAVGNSPVGRNSTHDSYEDHREISMALLLPDLFCLHHRRTISIIILHARGYDASAVRMRFGHGGEMPRSSSWPSHCRMVASCRLSDRRRHGHPRF